MTLRAYYDAQWRENKDNEAVFLMEGLSDAAARKLLVLARGRYFLAWQYFGNFRRFGLDVLEQGTLFSEDLNRDELARALCASPDGRAHFAALAKSFTRASAVTPIRDFGVVTLITCQDAREFLRRDRQLLAQIAGS
jgi:GAF domain-containing protein